MAKELMDQRKKEIVAACAKLYETKSFKEINVKNIGELTSVSRTSIYNYFETKEEIFLELLKNEYALWNYDLKLIIANNQTLTKEKFASLLSESVSKRGNLLKLLSMNLYDIEENSRVSSLTDFKLYFAESITLVTACLTKFFKKMSQKEKDDFIYSFFPFMYGIYPYTNVTKKQKKAMENAQIDYKYMSIYDITYHALLKLLN